MLLQVLKISSRRQHTPDEALQFSRARARWCTTAQGVSEFTCIDVHTDDFHDNNTIYLGRTLNFEGFLHAVDLNTDVVLNFAS